MRNRATDGSEGISHFRSYGPMSCNGYQLGRYSSEYPSRAHETGSDVVYMRLMMVFMVYTIICGLRLSLVASQLFGAANYHRLARFQPKARPIRHSFIDSPLTLL